MDALIVSLWVYCGAIFIGKFKEDRKISVKEAQLELDVQITCEKEDHSQENWKQEGIEGTMV